MVVSLFMCLQGFVNYQFCCMLCVFLLCVQVWFADFVDFCCFLQILLNILDLGLRGGGPHGVKLTMPFTQKAIQFFCPKTLALHGYHHRIFGELYCFFLKSVKLGLRFWVSVVIPVWLFFIFFVKLTLFLTSDSLEMRPPLQGLAAAPGVAAGQLNSYFVDVWSFYCVFARFCVVCVALTNCF